MTYEDAQFFWERYLGLIGKGKSRNMMSNPLRDLLDEVKTGKADKLSDEQFQKRKQEASELSLFWGNKPCETVGNILINALSKTNLTIDNLKTASMVLADASIATDYSKFQQPETCQDKDFWEDAVNVPDNPFDESPFDSSGNLIWTPRQIYDYLDEHVYGQESAKRAASMLMYHHLHKRRRNLIMTGPSGCGKTEIWRTLSLRFPYIKIINGPQLSCDGWKGSYHIQDIFMDEPIERARKLIIVIDEADKLFEPTVGAGGTDYARMIQNQLLKIMDGDTIAFNDGNTNSPSRTINCKNVSVVFCGTFESMNNQITESVNSIGFVTDSSPSASDTECCEEDFIQYANIRREIMGRINQIVTLEPLTASDFEAIMDGPASPIQKLSWTHRVYLHVDDETKHQLAKTAADSGLGCRYIYSRLQALLDEQMFDNPNSKTYTLSINDSPERIDDYAKESEQQEKTG